MIVRHGYKEYLTLQKYDLDIDYKPGKDARLHNMGLSNCETGFDKDLPYLHIYKYA